MLNPALNRNPLPRAAVLVTLLIGVAITASLPVMKTFAAEPAPPQARPQSAVPAPALPVAPVAAAPAAPVQRPPVEPPQLEVQVPNLELELNKNLKELASPGLIKLDSLDSPYRLSIFPQQGGGTSGEGVEMLIKLFDGSNDVEMKKHILGYLGMSNNPKAAEKVLSIARSNTDKEVQREAIGYLAQRPNAFDELVSVYDTSRDVEIKRSILDSIGMSRDPRATQKLFSIAQSDSDPELRRVAVDYIAFR